MRSKRCNKYFCSNNLVHVNNTHIFKEEVICSFIHESPRSYPIISAARCVQPLDAALVPQRWAQPHITTLSSCSSLIHTEYFFLVTVTTEKSALKGMMTSHLLAPSNTGTELSWVYSSHTSNRCGGPLYFFQTLTVKNA